jgi:hypothetical protein
VFDSAAVPGGADAAGAAAQAEIATGAGAQRHSQAEAGTVLALARMTAGGAASGAAAVEHRHGGHDRATWCVSPSAQRKPFVQNGKAFLKSETWVC